MRTGIQPRKSILTGGEHQIVVDVPKFVHKHFLALQTVGVAIILLGSRAPEIRDTILNILASGNADNQPRTHLISPENPASKEIRPADGTVMSWKDEFNQQRFGTVVGGDVFIFQGPDPVQKIYHPELARVITDQDKLDFVDLSKQELFRKIGPENVPVEKYQKLIDSVEFIDQNGIRISGSEGIANIAYAKALIAMDILELNESGISWQDLSRVANQKNTLAIFSSDPTKEASGNDFTSAVENWIKLTYSK